MLIPSTDFFFHFVCGILFCFVAQRVLCFCFLFSGAHIRVQSGLSVLPLSSLAFLRTVVLSLPVIPPVSPPVCPPVNLPVSPPMSPPVTLPLSFLVVSSILITVWSVSGTLL